MRSRGLQRLVLSVVVVTGAGVARAAEVRVQAPCAEADSIGEQVDGILGQPVASVEAVDFDVKIAAGHAGRWTLQVDTIDREAGTRRTRALTAATCAEAADAAAVAIAVSIKAANEAHPRPRKVEAPVEAPVEATPPVITRVEPAPPARATDEAARTSLALSIVGDSGTLPRAAFGLELDGTIRLRAVRLVGQGALFLPQEARLTAGAGGDFQFVVAGVLACLGGALGRVALQACAGGEAGRLAGTGFGVSSPRSVATLWLAGRAEAGVNVAVAPRVALALRIGAALPLFRPTFELDAATFHRADAVTGRATAGVEVTF